MSENSMILKIPLGRISGADEAIFRQIAEDVLGERVRQREHEGWTSDHDDQHANCEMARAAAAYALHAARDAFPQQPSFRAKVIAAVRDLWPWGADWWKPKGPRRDLVRAAALIVAEIERLDRAAERQGK